MSNGLRDRQFRVISVAGSCREGAGGEASQAPARPGVASQVSAADDTLIIKNCVPIYTPDGLKAAAGLQTAATAGVRAPVWAPGVVLVLTCPSVATL